MVIVSWIVLILSILFLLNSSFSGFIGLLYAVFFFALVIVSGIVIWEDVHSIKELMDIFK